MRNLCFSNKQWVLSFVQCYSLPHITLLILIQLWIGYSWFTHPFFRGRWASNSCWFTKGTWCGFAQIITDFFLIPYVYLSVRISIAMHFQYGHKSEPPQELLCVKGLMYSKYWRGETSRGCFSCWEVVLGFWGGTAWQGGMRTIACASSTVLEGRGAQLSYPLLTEELDCQNRSPVPSTPGELGSEWTLCVQVSAALTYAEAGDFLPSLQWLAGGMVRWAGSVGCRGVAMPVLGQGAGGSCTKALCHSSALRVRLDVLSSLLETA